jgi:lipopolysaccharide export system ATP-binding protein
MGFSFRIDRNRRDGQERDIPAPEFKVPDTAALPGMDIQGRMEQQQVVNEELVVDGNSAGLEVEPTAGDDKLMVLRTDNLVKKYGKRTVVNHVSISVTQGEIVGLLGPNGAGKTTTFYMTTGLVQPNEGRIFVDDLEITKYPVYRRAKHGIGYLAQEASVFRKLSVEDNIRAVLQMTDKSKEYQRDKLESLIAEFRLEKVRKNLGDQLSGGERRRTEIARCLAIDPKFIMLDEPFAGVDPIAVEDIQTIVYKLKDKNIGILITDHNAPETLSITDRAYLLFDGRILFQGTSEELAENPVVREKYLGRNFVFRRKKFD